MMAEQQNRSSRWLWRTLVIVAVLVPLTLLYVCWYYTPPTTVIVLRHADKVTDSALPDNLVPLSTSGQARATTFAEVAGRAGVSVIYVTEKLRTQQTAEPLANNLGLTPTQIAAADVDALIDEIEASKNRGRVIVVVGHSDTVPVIVDRLGGGTVTVGENQFDNLFVLTLHRPFFRWDTTRLIRATYGDPR